MNIRLTRVNTTTSIKGKFPLHYTTSRQTVARISHETDAESLLSSAKNLTHWNMRPGSLHVVTLAKEPTIGDIWSTYKDEYGMHDGVDLTSSFEEEIGSSEDESE